MAVGLVLRAGARFAGLLSHILSPGDYPRVLGVFFWDPLVAASQAVYLHLLSVLPGQSVLAGFGLPGHV